jgi:hypothetical protein
VSNFQTGNVQQDNVDLVSDSQGMVKVCFSHFKKSRALMDVEPNPLSFSPWNKVLQCLNFQELIYSNRTQNKRDLDYIRAWEPIWLQVGSSMDVHQFLLHPLQCAYPRCPAPYTSFIWECADCHAKCYCSRRCQQL